MEETEEKFLGNYSPDTDLMPGQMQEPACSGLKGFNSNAC